MLSGVVRLGLISLLTAIAGEAARAAGGPLLASLGANAAAVGIVAGAGELLGYTLRLGVGFLADRPGGAWRLLFIGTAAGISAVALMSLAPDWQVRRGASGDGTRWTRVANSGERCTAGECL